MNKKYIILNTKTQETFEYTFPWKEGSTTYVLDVFETVMETCTNFNYGEYDSVETYPSSKFILKEIIE